MINSKYSQEIYRQLINGKAINQNRYDDINDGLVDNEYFQEIHQNATEYKALFQNIGYELVLLPQFAYLKDSELSGDESSKTAIKIQAVLTVIAKITTQNNYQFALLTTPSAGISQELCATADQDETLRDILEACHCDSDKTLWDNAKNLLVGRGIAYLNAKQHLVLNDAGKAFFEQLFQGDTAFDTFDTEVV